MKFKDYLQKDLDRIGCSLSELSRASGLSSAVLSRYRSGERTPRRDSALLAQLCDGIDQLEQQAGLPSQHKNRLALYKASLSEELTLYYDRFDQLLRILHISMKDLSHELNYDASYLSRIRSGKRSPADPEQFVTSVSRFFIRSASAAELEEIGILIQESDPDKLEDSLRAWLLCKQEFNGDPIESFLLQLDGFNLDEFSRAISFENTPAIRPVAAPSSLYYHGTDELRQAELDFFSSCLLDRSESVIYMCNNMPIEEMAEDANFARQWMGIIAANLKNGKRLEMVHDINRSFSEMMIGLQAWIPVYMTGQIVSYYLSGAERSIFRHSLYVSDKAALVGQCIDGFYEHAEYHLTTDPDRVAYYAKRSADILAHAKPLMRIYRSPQGQEFDQFQTNEFQMQGDRVILSYTPPLALLTHDLLKQILTDAGIPEEYFSRIDQARKKELIDINHSLRKGRMCMRIPRISEAEFEAHTPTLKLAALFENFEVPYTWNTYQKHIKLLEDFADVTPDFDLVYDQHSPFRNITIYLRDDKIAMILKNKSPEIAFVLTHPNIVRALQQFTAPFYE